jgi:hypothetical protein
MTFYMWVYKVKDRLIFIFTYFHYHIGLDLIMLNQKSNKSNIYFFEIL